MTPKALSRTREEIEKDYNDCVQELKDERIGGYEVRSALRSAMAQVLTLEVLLDIRELLANPPIEISGVELTKENEL